MAPGANLDEDQIDHSSLTLIFPQDFSDFDLSFTSSSASTSSFAATFNGGGGAGGGASSSSARSSLSLISLPSLSSSSSLKPLPHRRSDPHWSAFRAASNLSPDGLLHLHHLKLLRHLGSGNLARVFHCRLRGFEDNPCLDFALKVVDLDAIADNDKLSHVRMEATVLAALDHPFLPTLYARLDASHYTCFLIDYCSGGDLHSLLRRCPGHRLPRPAAHFYAAEVLLALEYLHSLGFIYRDLKPENVLLQADGHVMLSDFDLCFHSHVSPALHRRQSRYSTAELEFVAEPVAAFSRACVGTHEYLAPEVVSGVGHSCGVDWWAFGVFIYELLYGRTPFKGGIKEATLKNILSRKLRFPDVGFGDGGTSAAAARDLISRLLVRDPHRRMGSVSGAAEIKRHPFFEGIRWPLIRMMKPPVVVAPAAARVSSKRWWSCMWSRCIEEKNKKTSVQCKSKQKLT